MAENQEQNGNGENGHGHDDDHGFAHPVPLKLLFIVFFSLVGLTFLTVALNYLPLGKLDIWVALVIASLKASLVCLFFMHMYWEKGFNVLAFFSSLLFVLMFIGTTMMDRGQYRNDLDSFPSTELPAARVNLQELDTPADGE